VDTFFSRLGNKVTRGVYCLLREIELRLPHAGVVTVLPYLGPEMIAVVQAACNPAQNDWRSSPRFAFPASEDKSVPSMVWSFSLRCSDSSTVGVFSFWVRWRP
jgi:hypothetical protein